MNPHCCRVCGEIHDLTELRVWINGREERLPVCRNAHDCMTRRQAVREHGKQVTSARLAASLAAVSV